jgi:hypothetical protein
VSTVPLNILFVMYHAGYVRNYQSVLRAMLDHGHRVHIAIENNRNKFGENVQVERLAVQYPRLTYGLAPLRKADAWGATATGLRVLLDYLRYLGPRYQDASALRLRVRKLVLPFLRVAADGVWRLGWPAVRLLSATVAWLERRIPPSPDIRTFLDSRPWSAVLVTPLIDVGSNQVDYVREAARARIPSALCVASWDNLTNKGLMRVVPDRVVLWNESQKAEAIEMHGVPADRVVVTGAQLFDHWFTWEPSRSREEFGAATGLRGERPFILYLGSSLFIAPREAEFVVRWLDALRASVNPLLSGAEVLIRPHPNNTRQWLRLEFAPDSRVSIWPPSSTDPFANKFKYNFFDSLYYAGVVVGVNTSAQIDAAILGKAVCTVRAPEFAHSQAGTLHFQHIAGDEGLVLDAPDLPRHLHDLERVLASPAAFSERTERFVKRFVRPRGLDRSATSFVVEAVEALATVVPVTAPAPMMAGPAAWFMRPLAVACVAASNKRYRRHQSWQRVARPVVWVAVRGLAVAAALGLLPGSRDALSQTAAQLRRGRQRQKLRRQSQKLRDSARKRLWKHLCRSGRVYRRAWRRARVILGALLGDARPPAV